MLCGLGQRRGMCGNTSATSSSSSWGDLGAGSHPKSTNLSAVSLCGAKQPHPQAGGGHPTHPSPWPAHAPAAPRCTWNQRGPCAVSSTAGSRAGQKQDLPPLSLTDLRVVPGGGPTTAPPQWGHIQAQPRRGISCWGKERGWNRGAGAGGAAPGGPGRVHAGKMLNLSSLFGARFPHPAPRGNREQGAGEKCQRGRPEGRESSEKAERGQS